ncbi:hypothetical protein MBLNU230_g0966t1 [Neophaeotheca triangularis]
MSETPTKKGGWTDAEKLGVLFQLVTNAGPGIWKDFVVPEGRTLGAVKVMLDREKKKIAKADVVGASGPTPSKRSKSTAAADDDDDDDDDTPAPKKAKASRKKKVPAAVADDDEEVTGVTVKAEAEAEAEADAEKED